LWIGVGRTSVSPDSQVLDANSSAKTIMIPI
jgi:hypothetical protein